MARQSGTSAPQRTLVVDQRFAAMKDCWGNRITEIPHYGPKTNPEFKDLSLRVKSAYPQGSETLRSLRPNFGTGFAFEPSRSARKPGQPCASARCTVRERQVVREKNGAAVGTGIQPSLVFVRRVSPAGSPRPVCWILAVPVPEIGQRLDDPTLTDDAALATRRHTLKLRTQRRETP